MNKKKTQRDPEAVAFAQARDEMFSHILRCGVIDALPEHQKDWFDDTMLYLADRYDDLTEEELAQLRRWASGSRSRCSGRPRPSSPAQPEPAGQIMTPPRRTTVAPGRLFSSGACPPARGIRRHR